MLHCVNGHDRCYLGPDPNCPYCERTHRLIRPLIGAVPTLNPLVFANGEPKPLWAVEVSLIETAVIYYHGRMSSVARALGMGRSTLYRKLELYGLRHYTKTVRK